MSDATVWVLTLKDKRVFLFDKDGRLSQMTDTNGNALSINRDAAGRVTSVSHSSGKAMVFHRNGAGRGERITAPAGAELKYGYDATGRLTVFHDRESDAATEQATASFGYKAGTNYLEDIFDGWGIRAIRNTYDAQRRLTKTTDADGKETIFTHNIAGRSETTRDRAGNVTTHGYDERGNVVETTSPDGTVTATGYHTWSDGPEVGVEDERECDGAFYEGRWDAGVADAYDFLQIGRSSDCRSHFALFRVS